MENGLVEKMEITNFWAVYMVVEILIGEGEEVALVMIEKLIH